MNSYADGLQSCSDALKMVKNLFAFRITVVYGMSDASLVSVSKTLKCNGSTDYAFIQIDFNALLTILAISLIAYFALLVQRHQFDAKYVWSVGFLLVPS